MTKSSATPDATIVKKYANRRLYNTQTSCYVTLEDLCDLIKRGEDFVVIDAKSEQDLTRSVLTQIIFEQESKGYNVLPISFLKGVVRFYDNPMSEVVSNYLEMAMDNFTQNQEQWQNQKDPKWDNYNPLGMFGQMTKNNVELFQQAIGMFSPEDEKK